MNYSDLYEALHDGEPARGVADHAVVATGPAAFVARVKSISYTTQRDGRRGVWEHEFEALPELLVSSSSGPLQHAKRARDLVLVGWGIDFVTEAGTRILTPGMAVCSTARGHLRIAWLESARYSLVPNDRAIVVDELGISG